LLARGDDVAAAAAARCLDPFVPDVSPIVLAASGPVALAMRKPPSPTSSSCADARVAEETLRAFERWNDGGIAKGAAAPLALARLLACGPVEPPRVERVLHVARSFPVSELRESLAMDLGRMHPTSREIQDHYVAMIREGADATESRLAFVALSFMSAGDDAGVCAALVALIGRAPRYVDAMEINFLPGARCASDVMSFFERASSGDVFVPMRPIIESVTTLCRAGKATATTRRLALALAPRLEHSDAPSDRKDGVGLRCACAPPAGKGAGPGCR
jgi:hypothetical protein